MTDTRVRRAPRSIAGVLAAVCCASAWLAACTPPSRDLQAGGYRAVVDSPGGDLPFGIDIAKEEKGFALYLVNGEERVAATNLRTEPGKVTAVFPGGASTLTASISGGELRGDIAFAAPGGRTRKLPFKAVLGQTWRFFEEPLSDNMDAAGRWAVTFTDDRGVQVRGVAEFRQKFEGVTGTVITKDVEHRVAGEVHGDQLLLSFFDGRAGRLYVAKANRKGELEGEAWSLPSTHLRFVAVRNPDATLEEAPVAAGADEPAGGAP